MIESNFDKQIINALRSKLLSRRMQYDIFTFSGSVASVNIHIPSTTIRMTVPFIIEQEDDKTIVFFETKEYEFESPSSAIAFLTSMARKTEAKLSRVKKK